MSTHASHGVHEIHHPVIVRLRVQVIEDVDRWICGIVVDRHTRSILIQLFVRDILAIRKFRSSILVCVDPLCLDACLVGDMFEHLRALVFIAHFPMKKQILSNECGIS